MFNIHKQYVTLNVLDVILYVYHTHALRYYEYFTCRCPIVCSPHTHMIHRICIYGMSTQLFHVNTIGSNSIVCEIPSTCQCTHVIKYDTLSDT